MKFIPVGSQIQWDVIILVRSSGNRDIARFDVEWIADDGRVLETRPRNSEVEPGPLSFLHPACRVFCAPTLSTIRARNRRFSNNPMLAGKNEWQDRVASKSPLVHWNNRNA
jgi:hypothetical protein